MSPCKHCGEPDVSTHGCKEHPGYCCDCYDLSWGMSLEDLNKERAEKGKPPILEPWPENEVVMFQIPVDDDPTLN